MRPTSLAPDLQPLVRLSLGDGGSTLNPQPLEVRAILFPPLRAVAHSIGAVIAPVLTQRLIAGDCLGGAEWSKVPGPKSTACRIEDEDEDELHSFRSVNNRQSTLNSQPPVRHSLSNGGSTLH